MGKESSDPSMISSRMCESLASRLALALDEPEREAVLGDIRESGDGGWKAMSEVLGLVIRRQAGAWKNFDLWLALVTLVVPLAFLLSTVSKNVIGGDAVCLWMYLNNWNWELAKSAGFWYVLREAALQLSINCILLACWSWSAGFVLGRLPKQFVRRCETALLVLLALSQASAVLERFLHFLMPVYAPPVAPLLDLNAPVTANTFYRVFFPWIVVASLMVLPALLGTRHGRQPVLRNSKLQVLLVTAAIVSLITMLLMLPDFDLLLGDAGRQWVWRNNNVIRMLPYLAYWPILYMLGIRLRQYWRAGLSVA